MRLQKQGRSSLDSAVMAEGRTHALEVIPSLVVVLSSVGAARVVAAMSPRSGSARGANTDGAIEIGAEAGRAGEDSADADLAADTGGVRDESAVLALAGGRAATARINRDRSVDALV